MVSPFGTIPALGARLAKLHLLPRSGADRRRGRAHGRGAADRHPPGRAGARGRHALPQRLRRGVVGPAPHDDDGEPDRPHRQPEHLGRRPARPAQGAARRRAGGARQLGQPPDQLLGARTTPRAPSSSTSTSSAASATPGPPRPAPGATRFHDVRRVVSNLGVFDFETPDRTMRLRSVHPGVTVDEVVAATGFELDHPRPTWPRHACRPPRSSSLIRVVLDPGSLRDREVRT